MTTKSKSRYKKLFTVEQRQEYKTKKDEEKLEIQDLYTKFLAKKTIQDFIGIIANYKQLHNYSIRNRILAIAQAEQREHKEFVGALNSFLNWKKQDIQILTGSKGYKILVPIFRNKKDENDRTTQPQNNNKETQEKILSFFKLGSVFDISQTSEYENYLKEREQIDAKIMKSFEIEYQTAYKFAKDNFPKISLKEDFREQEQKGSYNPHTHQITLSEESSHTILHELGHHITVSIIKIAGNPFKEYAKNEVLAELTAYLLMKSFDESIEYNFAYSNCWSNRITDTFELDEFETDFKAITQYLEKFTKKEAEHTNGM